MDLGEKVSVDMIIDEKHDESCAFCSATEKPTPLENVLEEHLDEDEEADSGDISESYRFKNDSGALGEALDGRPDNKTIALNGKNYECMVAAHHLIPGNASLKNSMLFKSEKYLWTDGKAKGNIGYNINNRLNGVWSPGNYAVRPWGKKGASFAAASRSSGKAYAYAAMRAWRCQFHDAHPDYSEFVKDSLDKLYEKLEAIESIWCPEAKNRSDKPEDSPPLTILVMRLNTISLRMKRMLQFPTTNWKRNIFTSGFVESFMDEEDHEE